VAYHPCPLVAVAAMAVSILLAGCGSPTIPTTGPTPSPGPLVVVPDSKAGAVLLFEATPSGALSLVSSLPVPGVTGLAAGHPNGQFVVVAGNRDLRTYAVDKATGQLSVRSVQAAPSGRPHLLSVAAAQRHVYVRNTAGSIGSHVNWARYSLDATTGILDACVNFCVADIPSRAEVSFAIPSPDGRFVYTDDYRGTVYTSALQPDGTLLDIGKVDLGTAMFDATAALGPGFLAVNTGDPAEDWGAGLLTLAIDPSSGQLSPRQKVEAPLVIKMVVSSTGLIAFWALKAPNIYALQTWSVDASGALTLRDSVPAAGYILGLSFDPTGRFLYASVDDQGQRNILAFAVDPGGLLRTLSTYPGNGGSIVVIPR